MTANGETGSLIHLLSDHTILNEDTEEELHCYGYFDDKCKKFMFVLLVIVTLGTILLVLYWKPKLECYLKKSRCALYRADTILLEDNFGQKYVCYVKSVNIEEEISGFTDAYNRDVAATESLRDSRDVASLIGKQMEPVVNYFDFQHVRYLWSNKDKTYNRLLDLSTDTRCADVQQKFHGLSKHNQYCRRLIYGENSINVHVKSYFRLFFEEVLNPFYIFQIFSIALWIVEFYYYYAACIFLISCISIGVSLYETKKQMITLHNMVSIGASTISVSRGDNYFEMVPVCDLVPGDVIAIPPHGCTMTCDAVLMSGNCIVNESMLTGESVPIRKTALQESDRSAIYSPDKHKHHTLFAGTKVIQTRCIGLSKVQAVVVRTGFSTAKGELVRAILFPKPLGFKFYQDAMRFIMFLALVAFFGMVYTIYKYTVLKIEVSKMVIRVLDIITIIVPPALPAAMTVGTVYAQNRLKKSKIFCTSPPRINFGGRLNLFCFDKTGTLTEDGLDLGKVIPALDGRFQHAVTDPSEMMPRNEFLVAMATCHSLSIIDGELSGDPMDIIMFNSTKWTLEEPGMDTCKFDNIMSTVVRPPYRRVQDLGEGHFEVGIVRQFIFAADVKRMSVIACTQGMSHMVAYCKGAAEVICDLCNKDTVPHNIEHVLHEYAVQGYRVIGLAWRPLDPKITWHEAQKIDREEVENSMTFLGLIVMQNKLKKETQPVIRTLHRAKIRCVMITGDMLTTAISVARNCGMVNTNDRVVIANACPPEKGEKAYIEWELSKAHNEESELDSEEVVSVSIDGGKRTHIAVSGKSFAVIEKYFPDLLPKICVMGTIFARMLPDQKCQLVQKLQELGYSVGMCGDGANDCEALKAAHAGISLSEAEASVAAPFTSTVNNIECVITLMREGRAALVTSFGCFKYMALYSFIQFISVMILYSYGVNLGDMQFFYIDLAITTTIAVLMGYNHAYDTLVARRPEGSLVKPANMISIVLQVCCATVFQVGALVYLEKQKWYVKVEASTKLHQNIACWESTIIFMVSSFQYLVVAYCFSKGPPFRQPIYTNVPLVVCLLLLTTFSVCLIMVPWNKGFHDFFLLKEIHLTPIDFRAWLLVIAGMHFIVACTIEFLVNNSRLLKCCIKGMLNCCQTKTSTSLYKLVEKDLLNCDWPPVGNKTYKSEELTADVELVIENVPFENSINR